MKITALKTYLVPPRWLFLKVETDAGIVGWGEPVLEGHAETLATKIEEMARRAAPSTRRPGARARSGSGAAAAP